MKRITILIILISGVLVHSQSLPDFDILNGGGDFIWSPGTEGLDEEEVYELMENTQGKVNRYILLNQFFGPDYIFAISSIFSLDALYGRDLKEPIGINYDPKKEALFRTLPINNRSGDGLESTFDRELMKYVEQVVMYSETILDYGGEVVLNDGVAKHYLVPEKHGGEIPEEGGLSEIFRELEVANRSHSGRYGANASYSQYRNDVKGNNDGAIRDLSNVFLLFNEIQNGKYTEYLNLLIELIGGGGEIDQEGLDDELLDISEVFETELSGQGFDTDFESLMASVYENMSEEEAERLRLVIEELYNDDN